MKLTCVILINCVIRKNAQFSTINYKMKKKSRLKERREGERKDRREGKRKDRREENAPTLIKRQLLQMVSEYP